jgi:hypothetical protein
VHCPFSPPTLFSVAVMTYRVPQAWVALTWVALAWVALAWVALAWVALAWVALALPVLMRIKVEVPPISAIVSMPAEAIPPGSQTMTDEWCVPPINLEKCGFEGKSVGWISADHDRCSHVKRIRMSNQLSCGFAIIASP